MQFIPTFRRNISLPSSWLKYKLSKNPARNYVATERTVHFQRTTCRYIPRDSRVHNQRYENLTSYNWNNNKIWCRIVIKWHRKTLSSLTDIPVTTLQRDVLSCDTMHFSSFIIFVCPDMCQRCYSLCSNMVSFSCSFWCLRGGVPSDLNKLICLIIWFLLNTQL
jgi:hypothetical protein